MSWDTNLRIRRQALRLVVITERLGEDVYLSLGKFTGRYPALEEDVEFGVGAALGLGEAEEDPYGRQQAL